MIVLLGLLVSVSAFAAQNSNGTGITSAKSSCQAELSHGTDTSLTRTTNPYEYADYRGPVNAVLSKLLATPVSERNPRLSNVCGHGKVFSFHDVLRVLSVNFDGEHKHAMDLLVYVNAEDPMSKVTPRAIFIQGSYSSTEVRIRRWIYEQYPDLKPAVEQWLKEGGERNNTYGEKPSEGAVSQWLVDHPEYAQGLLVFPRPTLWNRIGDQSRVFSKRKQYDDSVPIREAIGSGREYFIETIAALFDPVLAEENFDDLNDMLLRLAGPHVSRLSQQRTIQTIAQWVLTQYPELKDMIPGAGDSAVLRDKDSLSERYGRTLGIIPVEWATGDMKQAMPLVPQLQNIPREWEVNTLPKILSFIRGTTAPHTKRKLFELRDPETRARRSLRPGDAVELAFKPTGELYGNLTFLNQHSIEGVVHALIFDAGIAIGAEFRLFERDIDGNSYSKITGIHEKPVAYWFSDFEVEDSLIRRSGSPDETRANVDFSSYTFPEDSGDISIRYGSSGMQVPISKGDIISLSIKTAGQTYAQSTDMVVTGFQRDEEGVVTGIRGFQDGDYRFQHMDSLTRSADGMPISMTRNHYTFDADHKRSTDVRTTILANAYQEVVVLLSDIQRTELGTHHGAGKTALSSFRQPQSPKREKYNRSRTWRRSRDTAPQIRDDSGSFMLRIGREPLFSEEVRAVEQAPLSPGDEVLLHIKTPGTQMGMRNDRVLVSAIVREGSKIIGIQGQNIGSETEQTWLFASVVESESYIETKPWFGDRANSIPGAFDKRVPYKKKGRRKPFNVAEFLRNFMRGQNGSSSAEHEEIPFREDIFGYRNVSQDQYVATPDWDVKPLAFDDWLESNRLAKQSELQLQWAYWVLRVSPATPRPEILKKYRALVSQFHPDRGGDTEVMKIINVAYGLVDRFHD